MRTTLNLACSLDGRVAGGDGRRLTLSSPEDLERVHRLREACDAVLVGVGTVLADDPRLTARTHPPAARQPLRVVLDSHLRTPATAKVVDGAAPTLILTARAGPLRLGQAEVVQAGRERVDLDQALKVLEGRGVRELLVEGGPSVARSFLAAHRVGVFHLYVAPQVLGVGPSLWDALAGSDVKFTLNDARRLGEGVLLTHEVVS